jgi:hypothetical protein
MKYFLLILISIVCLSSFIAPPKVMAQQNFEYTVLAPLPGTTSCTDAQIAAGNTEGCKTDIKRYLEGFFKLLIGISVAFTVLNIVIGGFEYMTVENFSGKSNAKNRITSSLQALVLVIVSWVVLDTINPNLIRNLNLNIEVVNTAERFGSGGMLTETPTGSVSTPGRRMTEVEIAASNQIKKELEDANVKTYKEPCTLGQTKQCVNLNGLDPKLKSSVKTLASVCGCTINISGGTEGGHSAGSSHATGKALDILPNAALREFVNKNKIENPTRGSYTLEGRTVYYDQYIVNVGGVRMKFLDEGDHWHIENK